MFSSGELGELDSPLFRYLNKYFYKLHQSTAEIIHLRIITYVVFISL